MTITYENEILICRFFFIFLFLVLNFDDFRCRQGRLSSQRFVLFFSAHASAACWNSAKKNCHSNTDEFYARTRFPFWLRNCFQFIFQAVRAFFFREVTESGRTSRDGWQREVYLIKSIPASFLKAFVVVVIIRTWNELRIYFLGRAKVENCSTIEWMALYYIIYYINWKPVSKYTIVMEITNLENRLRSRFPFRFQE